MDAGVTEPLPDYDIEDLRDAGLTDAPHIGLLAHEFHLATVWDCFTKQFGGLIVASDDREPQTARFDAKILDDPRLDPDLGRAIRDAIRGGDLYSHQGTAIRAALDGEDVVVETATASGKSICYWTPILNSLLNDENATALYLGPLNALIEDQLAAIDRLGNKPRTHFKQGAIDQFVRLVQIGERSIRVARYEGSVKDPSIRRSIRNGKPRVLITNPDMLHHGILPYHVKLWQHLFARMRYIVLDEMHVYKGMFGAHVANVVRRVLRICAHYGRTPQIIGCSASIGNPADLFGALTGRRVPTIIRSTDNGAPLARQRRAVLDLARGKDVMPTLAKDLMVHSIIESRARTIAFMRSISEVDQVYRYVSGEIGRRIKGVSKTTIREYKREIPWNQKAEVTRDLRSGATLGVISTTALQLGIDIGDLSVCIICKFPGSKAAFYQQAGRVGRNGEGLVIFVADESPLDQHFAQRPEELLTGPSEVIYLNPSHRDTVLDHLQCAAEEMPLELARDSQFWGPELADLMIELGRMERMRDDGREVLIIERLGKIASEVNIRSIGFECIVRDEAGDEVARPDVMRAMRRFHKYARFQIQERAYEVSSLRILWDRRSAEATARRLDRLDYSTASVIKSECDIIRRRNTVSLSNGTRFERGDVRFVVRVEGYYRIPTGTGGPEYQPLGIAAPPRHELDTEGLWFSLSPECFEGIVADDWNSSTHSTVEALRFSAALLCSTDPDDIGSHIDDNCEGFQCRIYLADSGAGGDGLTWNIFRRPIELLDGAIRILADCPHCSTTTDSRGCPRCVTTPWGSDADVCRSGGIIILRTLRRLIAATDLDDSESDEPSADDLDF